MNSRKSAATAPPFCWVFNRRYNLYGAGEFVIILLLFHGSLDLFYKMGRRDGKGKAAYLQPFTSGVCLRLFTWFLYRFRTLCTLNVQSPWANSKKMGDDGKSNKPFKQRKSFGKSILFYQFCNDMPYYVFLCLYNILASHIFMIDILYCCLNTSSKPRHMQHMFDLTSFSNYCSWIQKLQKNCELQQGLEWFINKYLSR